MHSTWWTIKVSPHPLTCLVLITLKCQEKQWYFYTFTMIWNQAACTVILLNICGAVEVEISHLSSTYSVYRVF